VRFCGFLLSCWLHLSLNSLSNSLLSIRPPAQTETSFWSICELIAKSHRMHLWSCSFNLISELIQPPTDQLSTGAPCNCGLIDDSEYQVCTKDQACAIWFYVYMYTILCLPCCSLASMISSTWCVEFKRPAGGMNHRTTLTKVHILQDSVVDTILLWIVKARVNWWNNPLRNIDRGAYTHRFIVWHNFTLNCEGNEKFNLIMPKIQGPLHIGICLDLSCSAVWNFLLITNHDHD